MQYMKKYERITGSSWQRCKVHFMRNIMAHIPHKAKESFGAQLKQIWLQPAVEDARAMAERICEKFAAILLTG
jgi:putative transposase